MKKTVFTVLAALLALTACNKAVTPADDGGKTYSIDQLQFNFTIEREASTKGIRNGWLDGDKVFIFFGGVNDVYLTVTYDASTSLWSTNPELPSGMSVASLEASGVVTAVYLPYGNDRTPSWNGSAWVFNGTNDFYYMQAQKVTYFITDTSDKLATMGAYLYMETADGYIQFYLPDDGAAGTINLACNNLIPSGIGGIALDGTISDTNPAPGGWVTARADTIDGDTGYYVSGRLTVRAGLHYYLAMDDGSGTYRHFYKQRGSTLSSHGAYILPEAEDWPVVSSSTFVDVGGNSWCTMNVGATDPWDDGTAYSAASMSGAIATDTIIPADDHWFTLLDRTKAAWVQITVVGSDGYLVIDRQDVSHYFFLPCYNYWSTTVKNSVQHYLETAANGTHQLEETDPPSTAYVRLISTLYSGSFNPPEDGGDI